MAITTVNGEITRTFFEGRGAEVTESWTSNGETKTKRWSAFFDTAHGLNVSDSVTVSGMHGDKVDEWDKEGEVRHSVKRTLNKSKVEKLNGAKPGAAPVAPTAPSEPVADVWSTPSSYNDETPF